MVQIFILIISFPPKRPGQISEMRTHIQHPNFLRGCLNFWKSLRMHLFVIQIRPRTRGLRPSHVSRKRDYVVQLGMQIRWSHFSGIYRISRCSQSGRSKFHFQSDFYYSAAVRFSKDLKKPNLSASTFSSTGAFKIVDATEGGNHPKNCTRCMARTVDMYDSAPTFSRGAPPLIRE